MTISRRTLVAASALAPASALVVGSVLDAPPTQAAPVQPPIRPRADWAGNLKPKGRLQEEDDVRFLLVHHTLTPNTDTAEKVPDRLRSIFRFHTSQQRGWPDVAYNFFVDRFGTIWEGREGSITRPVRGDASGGSQGFALLCCFVGDFTAEVPTAEAMTSMTNLLAWLAVRERLDLAEPVTFASRGSSKWRKGVEVTTEPIAAHRDMSATECPGDALYPLVAGQLLPAARALVAGPTASATPSPASSTVASPAQTAPETPDRVPAAGTGDAWPIIGGAALAVGVAGAVAAVIRRRRRGSEAEDLGHDEHATDGQRAEQTQKETDQRS